MRIVLLRLRVVAVIACLALTMTAAESRTQKRSIDLTLFRHVGHVGWVVKDLDRVVAYWERLGLRNIRRDGVQDFPDVTWRGRQAPMKLKQATVDIGEVTIRWIQPIAGENAYADFLRTHGDGIQHLAYALPTEAQWREQLASFRAQGVDVLQAGGCRGRAGRGLSASLDTAARGGGLTIELEHSPDGAGPRPAARTAHEYPLTKITQYAFIVRDLQKVSDFYRGIGLGPFPFDRNISIDRMYRGRAVPFEMYLGWWRNGDVPFEWIQPLVGPSIYHEYLERHGEGFHHLAFDVRDMDAAVALMKDRGASVTQSGGWDTPTSSGRFAYLDTERYGGVSLELLWNKP